MPKEETGVKDVDETPVRESNDQIARHGHGTGAP